ncbi:MAG: NTP transferase domain-containing protein [Anaerolineales bacterium]|jgi:GTP:adenosylcobinamide-phosphate guanylyltransferase
MDAIITAGGIPLPEEPLYAATQGHPKAMVDIAGKPMIQWVLDALSEAKTVDHVIIVGLTEKSGLTCGKEITYIPNQGKMVENLQAGARKALEITPKARQVLMISSDIPAITGEMVDWVANNAMQTNDDIYYHIIERAVMEKRFPGSKRTWTRLKDMEVCGGDMNVARLKFLASGERGIWDKILDARKSPLKQAALVGFDTALLLIIGQLELEKAVATISKRLKVAGRAVICPYAEVGMDVDKPHQLEIMRADLKKHMRAADGKTAARKPLPKQASKSKKPAARSSATKKTVRK